MMPHAHKQGMFSGLLSSSFKTVFTLKMFFSALCNSS